MRPVKKHISDRRTLNQNCARTSTICFGPDTRVPPWALRRTAGNGRERPREVGVHSGRLGVQILRNTQYCEGGNSTGHAGWPGFITRSTCAHIRTRYDLTPMAPDAGAHIAREIEMPTRATSRLIQTCASLSNGDSASALSSAKGGPRNPRPTTYATAREKASVSLIKSRKDGGRARNVSCLTRRPP